MTHTPHELHEEFPDKAAQIHALKTSDPHFARLADAYHELNRAIHRMETDVEPAADEAVEAAKKQRLALKDELSGLIA